MFGLPQGFSASTLGWSYYEFQDSFDNLGLTDHYQEIMKEFCDFFVKSTKMSNGTVSQLYVQKGDGGTVRVGFRLKNSRKIIVADWFGHLIAAAMLQQIMQLH